MDGAGEAADARAMVLAQIEHQRAGCEAAGSPLWGEVLRGVAADIAAGGPTVGVLLAHAAAPPGDAVVLRLLAALHEVALAGEDPDLAAQLPSTGGAPDTDLAAVAVAAIGRHRDRLAEGMRRPVQTNEPGRSVALLCGLAEVAAGGLPLVLLEVGASAGLNLWFDRYRVATGGSGFGPIDSPLRFEDPFSGRAPDLPETIEIAEHRGCDRAPLDPASPEGRLRLRSLVWPDHMDRRERLERALDAVAGTPMVLDRADAVDWTAANLVPRPGVFTVVMHSIVLQYLRPERRRALLAVIEAAGAAATPDAPVAWLRTEPGGPVAETRLTIWPGGTPVKIASSGYHGPPVTWHGPSRT